MATKRNAPKNHWFFALLLLISAALFSEARAETDPRYYAVMVSAEVQASPVLIRLQWDQDSNATSYSIARRNGNSWTPLGTVSGSAQSWVDANVAVGGAYEYRVTKTTSVGYNGTGFVFAGINAPITDSRGKLILLVEKTHAAALAAELTRLEWDLAGDGWIVVRKEVSQGDSVASIKNVIKSIYDQDPRGTKAVFLFGHVPVPYSGNFRPDYHSEHLGAWPADVYYGDMDGTWTDSIVSSEGAERPANHNFPGDGKFDQSEMPSSAELAVGRVDFHNMTCYANKSPARSEVDLLRAYLNKDHSFRHGGFSVQRRGLVCDNFGERQGEAFASSGWRNFGAFFGADNVVSVSGWQYFPTLSAEGYLWSYGTGGGTYYTCDGIGGSDDFARTEIKSVFTMFVGSFFGDWDNESNFLRAALGSGYCLTTSWAGRPHWFYHHMALGETIGYSTLATQNNWAGGLYGPENYGTRGVHVALLGDPTLRMHPVIPPGNLRASTNGTSLVLAWDASTDSALAGYHVYRGSGPGAAFTRLTSSPIGATTFTDHSPLAGSTYMVRAIKLETSGGGTYFNPSQGVFHTPSAADSGGNTVPPPEGNPLAVFIDSNSSVSGDWIGKYGSNGYNIITGPTAWPATVQINAAGKQDYQWSDYAKETRALETPGEKRIAAAWFSNTSFHFDLSFADNVYTKLTLYFLDWDRSGRNQRVEMIDLATGSMLDSRTISNFDQGLYLSWNARGNVRVRCTNLSGNNAVVSGLFLDPGTFAVDDKSPHPAIAATLSQGSFRIQVSGVRGKMYRVLVSPNLTDWSPLATLTMTDATQTIVDPAWPTNRASFYRVTQSP